MSDWTDQHGGGGGGNGCLIVVTFVLFGIALAVALIKMGAL